MREAFPILQVGKALIASLPSEVPDSEAQAFQLSLLAKIRETRSTGVIIDLSSVDIVDTFLGRVIRDTAAMVRLMGGRTVVVGLHPAVAITLVELGLDLPVAHVDLDLGRGLAWLATQQED